MAPERNIRLTAAYDGTDFSGWQRQKHGRSVQGEIERALEILHGHPVSLHGAGRTDAGVHAVAQTANFLTDISAIPPGNFVSALNSSLPADVRIMESAEAGADFHARFSARFRRYRYFLKRGEAAYPHERRYCWPVRSRLDLAALNRMAARLSGETDFSSFSSPKDPSLSRFRYVYDASFYPEGNLIVFDISANAFLWKMVRSLVGTMAWLQARDLAPEAFAEILSARDRSAAGPTAPPEGLFLYRVEYPAPGEARPDFASGGAEENDDE
jgi:tRNA pseudouridine38-40 synthase